jgi:hypothetical protein
VANATSRTGANAGAQTCSIRREEWNVRTAEGIPRLGMALSRHSRRLRRFQPAIDSSAVE